MKVRDPGDKLLQQKEDSPYLFCSPFTGQIPVWSFKMIVIPFDPGIPLLGIYSNNAEAQF